MMILSIIICTHNRASLLDGAIQSVVSQAMSPEDYELIIVDNASTDHTRKVVESWQKEHPQVLYVFEAQQGLSFARNRGWKEARGKYMGYLDDDARADPNWLKKAVEIVDEYTPDVFGGPFYAFYLSPKPDWYKDDYGSHVIVPSARMMSRFEYPDGGNLFVSQAAMNQLGGFDVHFGMNGQKMAYGEETELVERLRNQKPDCRVYYDPALRINHLVAEHKMHFGWILKSNFQHGFASYNLFAEHSKRPIIIPILMLLRTMGIFVIDGSLRALFRNRLTYPFIQNYWYERSFGYFLTMGSLWAEIKSI